MKQSQSESHRTQRPERETSCVRAEDEHRIKKLNSSVFILILINIYLRYLFAFCVRLSASAAAVGRGERTPERRSRSRLKVSRFAALYSFVHIFVIFLFNLYRTRPPFHLFRSFAFASSLLFTSAVSLCAYFADRLCFFTCVSRSFSQVLYAFVVRSSLLSACIRNTF